MGRDPQWFMVACSGCCLPKNIMTGRIPTDTGTHLNSSEGTNHGANLLKSLHIAWVEIHNGSWWPGQVDEENVKFKREKKAENEVLVRLCGTYDYIYVDPIKSSSGFQNFLNQENCSMREAFQKALEDDISRMKSAGSSKRKRKKSNAGASEGKKQKQEHIVIDLDSDDSASQELPSGVLSASKSKGKGGKGKEASGGSKGKGGDTMGKTPKKNRRKQEEADSEDKSAKKTKQAEASKAKNSNPKAARGSQKEKDESKGKASNNVNGKQDADSKETSAEKTDVEEGKNGSSGVKNKKKAVVRSKIRSIEEHLKTKSPACKTPPTSAKGETREGTPGSSSRRVRVMRDMGLIAPLGSPFR